MHLKKGFNFYNASLILTLWNLFILIYQCKNWQMYKHGEDWNVDFRSTTDRKTHCINLNIEDMQIWAKWIQS